MKISKKNIRQWKKKFMDNLKREAVKNIIARTGDLARLQMGSVLSLMEKSKIKICEGIEITYYRRKRYSGWTTVMGARS
ncbi:hypothetical protein ACXM0N_17990 [Peribacillus simplex]